MFEPPSASAAPHRPRRRTSRALIAVVAAAGALVGYSELRRLWIEGQPLPGLAGQQDRCAVWFVGSSTISRWSSLRADMAPWPAVNRGVAGANLDQIAHRFERDRAPAPPAAIVFYAGENDIAEGHGAAVAAAEMRRLLAVAARAYPGSARLVVGLKPSPTRWSHRSEQLAFNAAIPATAKQTGAVYVRDGEQLIARGRPDPALYAEDGIHLDSAGYVRWVAPLRDALDRVLPVARAACLARR